MNGKSIFKKVQSLGQRGILLYVILFMTASRFNWPLAAKHRLGYLWGIFLQSDMANWNDGFLFFEKKIAKNPDEASAYAGLGVSCLYLGRYDEAETLLKKALDMSPQLYPSVKEFLAELKQKKQGSNQ